MYQAMYCNLDERPNDRYILSQIKYAVDNHLTPNQLTNYIMPSFTGHVSHEWVLHRIVTIQLNLVKISVLVGCGENFPFETRPKHWKN